MVVVIGWPWYDKAFRLVSRLNVIVELAWYPLYSLLEYHIGHGIHYSYGIGLAVEVDWCFWSWYLSFENRTTESKEESRGWIYGFHLIRKLLAWIDLYDMKDSVQVVDSMQWRCSTYLSSFCRVVLLFVFYSKYKWNTFLY